MRYDTLDVIYGKKVLYLNIRMDISEHSFEHAVIELGLSDSFFLYVSPENYLEALKILAVYLVVIDSDKKPKDLIRILKKANCDDWLVEKGDTILICPGA